MNDIIITNIANELKVKAKTVSAVLQMLEEGSTVPFIARYRKESTEGMDEEGIKKIDDIYQYAVNLFKRKEDVIRLIEEQGLLTDELKSKILAANKLVEVEDLYRPFKEKKHTKATKAIEMGLEPLAKHIMTFPKGDKDEILKTYLSDKVEDTKSALTNALFIIAEWISDEATYRKIIRSNMISFGTIKSKIKKNAVDEKKVFELYYDHSELVARIKPHRVLALNRAEDLKIISISIDSDIQRDINFLESNIIKSSDSCFIEDIKEAILDSYKRLIFPSIEREVRSYLTDLAEEQAILIFSKNLKDLLLQAPIKGKIVLGVDPAFRTGCKLALVDSFGKVLQIGVIYPNEKSKGSIVSDADLSKSKKVILDIISKYKVDIIAIGNGTASRETESFIANIIKEHNLNVSYVIVSEAGASVYSASDVARDEFPDYEVQERSAVSIARRLQDPLSELVKIEPKAIGVGQYQHDVTKSKLEASLDYIVSEAVNKVGVDLNTASHSLLMYVSGLTKSVAKNIIKYREENGPFKNRNDLLNVPKLGKKAFEQSVGFLRVLDGEQQLDKTSIHPESYEIALKLLDILDEHEIGSESLINKIQKLDTEKIRNELNIDKYTFKDIVESLCKPLRDIRDNFQTPTLRSDILQIDDLKVGDELQGTVRNVVDFGAFIDIGLKNDGLVHISKMSKTRIKHPSDLLSVGQIITVYVLEIDLEKSKVALSLLKT
ncbi:MAG: Tex family protein [Anaeroplasmataceae bacterium]